MKTFVVVEVNCTGYGRDDFSDACKVHVFKEFVFHCIVDSLRLGVVFGVSGFGHADADMPVIQNADIVRTGVLAATVGVVDKTDVRLFVNMPASIRQTACKGTEPHTVRDPSHAGSLPLGASFFSYRDIELGLCDIYEFIVCFRLDLGIPELLPQSLQLVLKCLYGLRLFISLNSR